jgi:hypothetical protein
MRLAGSRPARAPARPTAESVAPGRAGRATDLRAFALLLLLALLGWALAYQLPLRLNLAIGGDNLSQRREDDRPFLANFHGSEPADRLHPAWPDWTAQGPAYRWTGAESSMRFPGIGGGPWQLALRASSGRPDGSAISSTWSINGRALPPISISATERVYHVIAHADAAGTLEFTMRSPAYQSAGDPRELGFVLRKVSLHPATSSWHMPAWPQLGWLALSLTLMYGLARGLALRRSAALALAGLVALAVLLSLALARPALTLFAPTLAALLLACVPLALLLWGAGRWLRRAYPVTHSLPQAMVGAVVSLVVLAFVLRLGGMLHPHAIFSDHRFNANNLFRVSLGQVYFTAGLPDEAGGGQAPYPPGLYLLLMPAQFFFSTDMAGRVLLVQAGTALLDALVVALIALMIWQAGLGRRAALLGAACYLLPPPMMASFSVGEYANLGGQVLALPAIALAAAWGAASNYALRRRILLLIALIAGLLGHFGVAISLGLFGVALLLVDLGALLSGQRRRQVDLGVTLGLGTAALAIAALIYYTAPLFVPVFAERLSRVAVDATGGTAPGTILAGLGQALLLPGSRIAPLLLSVAAAGSALLWQWRPQSGLLRMLLAWWLSILLAQALLLIASQGLRWQHFLYPALCLGAGPFLAALWRRGQAGQRAAFLIPAWLFVYGMNLWIARIRDYLH